MATAVAAAATKFEFQEEEEKEEVVEGRDRGREIETEKFGAKVSESGRNGWGRCSGLLFGELGGFLKLAGLLEARLRFPDSK